MINRASDACRSWDLDTPRMITDTAGNIVWQWDNSDPYGNNEPNENPTGQGTFEFPLRFAGQTHDKETGLNQNHFRDGYNAAIGGYTQSDPIGLAGGSFSTYTYVGGNPLSRVDPLGLAAQSCDTPPTECKKMGEQSSKWPGIPSGYKRCIYSCKTSSGTHTIPRFVPESQECPDKLENQWVPGTVNPPAEKSLSEKLHDLMYSPAPASDPADELFNDSKPKKNNTGSGGAWGGIPSASPAFVP